MEYKNGETTKIARRKRTNQDGYENEERRRRTDEDTHGIQI
jgi:hypothetical protein